MKIVQNDINISLFKLCAIVYVFYNLIYRLVGLFLFCFASLLRATIGLLVKFT